MTHMEQRTILALDALIKALEEDTRMVALAEAEEALSRDEGFLALSAEKDAKAESFEKMSALYGENSEKGKEALHELYLAKKAMDEHPLALAYELRYKEVRRLLYEVDEIIFGRFRDKPSCGGCHDSH